MKLRVNDSLEESLKKLIARTKKPSFDNNKGLTKIEQSILLDSIEFIEQLLEIEKEPTRESSERSVES
jgi:hypothetical protein